MVLMNSGAALACAGLADNMGDGIEISREMITSGAALERLRLLQKASQVLATAIAIRANTQDPRRQDSRRKMTNLQIANTSIFSNDLGVMLP